MSKRGIATASALASLVVALGVGFGVASASEEPPPSGGTCNNYGDHSLIVAPFCGANFAPTPGSSGRPLENEGSIAPGPAPSETAEPSGEPVQSTTSTPAAPTTEEFACPGGQFLPDGRCDGDFSGGETGPGLPDPGDGETEPGVTEPGEGDAAPREGVDGRAPI